MFFNAANSGLLWRRLGVAGGGGVVKDTETERLNPNEIDELGEDMKGIEGWNDIDEVVTSEKS